MHDLIYRQDAIDILDAYQVMVENGEENPYTWARFRMSELPSAQPERKTGKWRRRLVDSGFNADWHCSECGWKTSLEEHGYNFCPNCGADMRGEGGK